MPNPLKECYAPKPSTNNQKAANPHHLSDSTITTASLDHLVDLDQSWCKQSLVRNLVGGSESRTNSDSTNGQSVHQVLNEGEEGIESDDCACDADVGERLWDGHVLLVDILKGQGSPVELAEIGCCGDESVGWESLDIKREGQGLVDGLDVLGGEVQDAEDREVDQVLIWAGAGNSEGLESTECKLPSAGSQERKLIGDEVLVR